MTTRRHMKGKLFRCELCNITTSSASGLQEHNSGKRHRRQLARRKQSQTTSTTTASNNNRAASASSLPRHVIPNPSAAYLHRNTSTSPPSNFGKHKRHRKRANKSAGTTTSANARANDAFDPAINANKTALGLVPQITKDLEALVTEGAMTRAEAMAMMPKTRTLAAAPNPVTVLDEVLGMARTEPEPTLTAEQTEEVEALAAIFGEDYALIGPRTIAITLSKKPSLMLRCTMHDEYPGGRMPTVDLRCSALTRRVKDALVADLQAMFVAGEPVIFAWTSHLTDSVVERWEREELIRQTKLSPPSSLPPSSPPSSPSSPPSLSTPHPQMRPTTTTRVAVVPECPPIHHGQAVTVRKSTFQAHLAHVTSTKQVHAVLATLLQNRKIANATHNMMAYRFTDTRGGIAHLMQDNDDDGEKAAGSRMAHLLSVMGVMNVMVVVSRWYGGILLGPSRFKIINNCTRTVLTECGFVD